MPATYHIIKARKLIVLCHIGTVTDEEMLATLQGIVNDPGFDPNYDKILDLRRTESRGRTNAAIQRSVAILEKVHQRSVGSRFAVIAPRDLSYGLGRVFEGMLFGSNMEIKIFRLANAACNWLKLTEVDLNNMEAA